MLDDSPDLFSGIIRRQRPRALPALSINIGAFAERLDDLSLIEEAAFWRLTRSYWRNGELPRDPARLAAICKVTPQRWRRMEIAMQRVFDVDDSGRLRDIELEEQRAAALAKSERNARTARDRWRASNPDANGDANAYANASPFGGGDAAGPDANGSAFAVVPFSRGKEGRKVGSEEIQEDNLPSSLPSGSQPPRTGPAIASPDASLSPASSGPVRDAPADASGDANASPGQPQTISNRDLAQMLGAACKGKVEAGALRPNGFRKIRAMMQEGFDLHGEILPALTANIDTVEGRLQHFGSAMVRGWVQDHREDAALPRAQPGPARTSLVYVDQDSAGWKAHQATRQAMGLAPLKARQLKQGMGLFLESLYPNVAPIAGTADQLGPAKPSAPSMGTGHQAGSEERAKARGG